ncbi:MAG: hypothetical protein V2I36_19375 [Desulfopila sp.]|jgi:hypothetical protein|nr:hypothetical protein [Desulfopila sp.]
MTRDRLELLRSIASLFREKRAYDTPADFVFATIITTFAGTVAGTARNG